MIKPVAAIFNRYHATEFIQTVCFTEQSGRRSPGTSGLQFRPLCGDGNALPLQDLFGGRTLTISRVPGAQRRAFTQYIFIDEPDELQGCLQCKVSQ